MACNLNRGCRFANLTDSPSPTREKWTYDLAANAFLGLIKRDPDQYADAKPPFDPRDESLQVTHPVRWRALHGQSNAERAGEYAFAKVCMTGTGDLVPVMGNEPAGGMFQYAVGCVDKLERDQPLIGGKAGDIVFVIGLELPYWTDAHVSSFVNACGDTV